MKTTKQDFRLFDSLSILKVQGYKPKAEEGAEPDFFDLPGSANWLVESGYGMMGEINEDNQGVIATDYNSWNGDEWAFSLLIDSAEVGEFTRYAIEAGYAVEAEDTVSEPMRYGDEAETVEVVRHRDGWIVLD